MLKKRLGLEAIERDWDFFEARTENYFKTSLITLIIPEGCEKIGEAAFKGCLWFKKVIIPESVKWIGQSAFYNCWRATIILKKPEKNFESIKDCAFYGCKDVKEVVRKEVRSKSWWKRLALFWNNIFKKI